VRVFINPSTTVAYGLVSRLSISEVIWLSIGKRIQTSLSCCKTIESVLFEIFVYLIDQVAFKSEK